MSLTIGPDTTNEASGPSSSYPSSDDDDSSVLADLVAMFPTLDHEVILAVLQAHDGRLQAAVEYLITSNLHEELAPLRRRSTDNHSGLDSLDPGYDMVGQFSEDIGGLPEVLPRYMYDDVEGVSEEDCSSGGNNDVQYGTEVGIVGDHDYSHQPPPPHQSPDPDEDNDPLPTYEEACTESRGDVLPPLALNPNPDNSQIGSKSSRSSRADDGGSTEMAVNPLREHKKKKGKKLHKMASKLKSRKKGTVKASEGSSYRHPQHYQPLIDVTTESGED